MFIFYQLFYPYIVAISLYFYKEVRLKNTIETCECCEIRYSFIPIEIYEVKYKEQLFDLVLEGIKKFKLKGSLTLVCTKDYIFGFKYAYKNKKEEALEEKIWDKVNDVAIEFGTSLLNYDEVEHYSKKAA